MELDPRIIWNLLLTFGIGPLYWFIKRMANELRELEKRITEHEISATREYVTRDDYHRDVGEIKVMLSDIFRILRESGCGLPKKD